MRRRLFTFLSVASLLLSVAVCVPWVWSYWYYGSARWMRVVDRDGNGDGTETGTQLLCLDPAGVRRSFGSAVPAAMINGAAC